MFEIILWSGIIFGGSIAYSMLGGQPAPKEEKKVKETKTDNRKETYDYFMDLSLDQQHQYINNNHYLREYKNELCYDNKQSTAREVARRAEKLNKSFTDRYDRF